MYGSFSYPFSLSSVRTSLEGSKDRVRKLEEKLTLVLAEKNQRIKELEEKIAGLLQNKVSRKRVKEKKGRNIYVGVVLMGRCGGCLNIDTDSICLLRVFVLYSTEPHPHTCTHMHNAFFEQHRHI